MKEILINKCIESIYYANQNKSKLNELILKYNGMSSQFQRHLLNNICNFNTCNYLEVGSYLGSTLCSAAFQNEGDFKGVENFTEFVTDYDKTATYTKQYVKENLKINIEQLNQKNIEIIEANFFNHSFNFKNKINVFFYDGIHRESSQFLNLYKAKEFLNEYFIYIVDDYFCEISLPKKNSLAAINQFNFEVLFYSEIYERNGTGIFVLKNK